MAITYTAGVNSPTNLWQLVQDYVVNTESTFVADIPTFVQLAEERISNDVQIPPLRKNVTGTLTANNKYLAMPADWLAPFSLAVITPVTLAQTYLLNKDPEYIRESYPVPSASGTPQHYAQFDTTTLIVGPTPDVSYAVEMHYYAYPASITTATTTWVGTNASSALLYGTLREAYLYMKGEEDIIKYYESKYQESMESLKTLVQGKLRQDTYRAGLTRRPV